MDQKTLEEGGQNALNFKCVKILHGADKSIACQTPKKTGEPLPTKSKEGSTKLPETHKALAELFDHMSCSLRLLRLCKKSATFQNICSQVEVLAARKVSYTDLAQIKYILPEAIHIEKVLVHDNRSSCMKPDLKITLVYEAVLGHSSENTYMALRQLFSAKLLEFFNTHPENTDIPEAKLPEPFQQRTHSLICEDFPVDPSTVLSSPTSDQNQQLQECQPYPFKRHFSKNNVVAETENNVASQISQLHHLSDCVDNEGGEGDRKGQNKCTTSCLKSESTNNQDMEKGQQNESCSMGFLCSVFNTPARLICSPQSITHGSSESSYLKIASSTDIVVTETPAQSTPRRLVPNSDVKLKIMITQNSISCTKQVKRVLFSQEGDYDADKLESSRDAFDNIPEVSQGCTEDFNISCTKQVKRVLFLQEGDYVADKLESSRDAFDNIPEASQGCTEDFNISNSVVLSQKVAPRLDISHENTNQTQGGSTTWQQIPSPLLGLFDVIYSIFCAVKFSPITKEELLHKIIMNSLDFVEMREAEEQINFLEKVVPDWIYRKLGPSGGIMYCIKEVSDLESVRSRLSSNSIKA
ncbi:CDT1-like protein a, chloroplastic [Prosopis cineraria]|uniref:CDT1-like protein a, chloroplastic n=1 Tax=Prosopis cineraria TaxID=364024 RepID=UPI00240F3064|nr:CDT1-like protein a, chloroplastic [Prosopis cineraria]